MFIEQRFVMQKVRAAKVFGRRAGKFLAGTGAVLCLLYLMLLIPEPEPAPPAGAGGHPFAWQQDAVWSELERQFVDARASGCRELTGPIASALSELERLDGKLSMMSASPQDEIFTSLETGLFRLAPLVAACPEGLSNYIAVATRARAEVKRQSEHWDLRTEMVLRLRADLAALIADPMLPHTAANRSWASARQGHIPYDFAMNHRDHQAQFCSEVVSAAYEAVGLKLWTGLTYISSPTVVAWLGSLGVRYFETQEPADLEYDPQLRVVAEWRERSTLFKAHVDDAVTDVMLEDAPPGRGLAYQPWLLPPTRLAKAYSAALNALGKTGPVPEGMSATVALRVKRFRRDHSSITARVLFLAGAYERQHGYAPPYWELIKLARQARRDLGMIQGKGYPQMNADGRR